MTDRIRTVRDQCPIDELWINVLAAASLYIVIVGG
jgi:hypothetical protein